MSLEISNSRNLVIALALGVLAIALGTALGIGYLGILPAKNVRKLAQNILNNTYNPWNQNLTSYSLNSVSAVVWDYRGLDTIFETMVLLTAVIGISILFYRIDEKKTEKHEMPFSTKISTQLITIITVIISFSIAVHGHLTPGGGFQAGSILAVTTALIIMVFSSTILYKYGLSTKTLSRIRFVALFLILFIALLPLLISATLNFTAYIMQNQIKIDSPFSMPSILLNTPLAGSIFFFNIVEFIAIATAFSYILILFSIDRKEIKNMLKSETK